MQAVTPRVSIVIPHYNQVECLKVLLPSIANQTFTDYEVIIIDDCSLDKSVVEYIKSFIKDYKNMRLIENAENMRFIKTVNRGIGLSNGEYICLLNSDTEVKKNFVERNVEILDADASIAGLSCIIVDKYNQNWWTGGGIHVAFPVNLTDDFEGLRRVDFVAGTAAFYRKEVFDKIGLFDESFRMYHEDVDFGLRIRAETNYKTCAFSDRLVVHYNIKAIPGPEATYLLSRNQILIARRYFPKFLPLAILKYLIDKTKPLANDILGLHPWLFLVDALQCGRGIGRIFGALLNNPSRIPRLSGTRDGQL